MNQLKSIYNSPFIDTCSQPIHTHFAMIASNALFFNMAQFVTPVPIRVRVERTNMFFKAFLVIFTSFSCNKNAFQ